MNSEATAAERDANAKIQADSQHGVVGSWWQLAIGMTESTTNFGFGVAQDSRNEVRRRVDATLNFAEQMGVGGFGFLRNVVERVDRVSGEVLGRGEAAILVVTRTMRRTGHGMTELASTTLSDTIGSPQPQRKDNRDGRPAAASA
jgi:hypothetical protein